MQLREVPVTPVPEGSDELDDEADWIYKQAFCKPTITTQVKFYSLILPKLKCIFKDYRNLQYQTFKWFGEH